MPKPNQSNLMLAGIIAVAAIPLWWTCVLPAGNVALARLSKTIGSMT